MIPTLQQAIVFSLVVLGLYFVIRYLMPAKTKEPLYLVLGVIVGIILLYILLTFTGLV